MISGILPRRLARFPYWIGIALLCAAATAAAGAPGTPEQRADFLAAERHLEAGEPAAARAIMARLAGYPLLPYLTYRDLRQRLAEPGVEDAVHGFLQDHAGTHLAPRLRRAWLRRLAEDERWEAFLALYDGTGGTQMQCRALRGMLAVGRRDEALAQVPRVWLAGRSQPEACDPVFDAWRSAGGLTPALTWARIRLVMAEGQTGLAGYLARYLPAADRPAVALWRAVHRDPALSGEDHRFDEADPRHREIRLAGLIRWAWRDPSAAAAALQELVAQNRLAAADAADVQRALGLSLYGDGRHAEARARLAAVPAACGDERVRETRVLAALLAGDWGAALRWLDALTPEEAARERWRYWRARALEATGEEAASQAAYAELAGERDYYGFLAADRAGLPYSLNHEPMALPADEIAAVAARPALRRVAELDALGRRLDMRREWYHLLQTEPPRVIEAAAVVAHRNAWHFKTIWSLGRTGAWDDMDLRFPLAFREAIEAAARREILDPAWVYAVARQESAFATGSRSPAGALGLMQIMPGTARAVAARLGEPRPRASDLLEIPTSLRLGSAYLRELKDALGGRTVLATAAYNAGPHRVRQWLPKEGTLAGDLWVEAIPYRETRRYVRRVLAYTAIYERRLGREPTPIAGLLDPVPGGPVQARAELTGDAPRG